MKRKRIVTIGGGTGSFTLLSGLKKYQQVDISAVVSMADDGGSAGVLRDELGVLPPGDVRQCLVALSESSEMLRKLMAYRFDKGGLKGHAFGNLFLSALEKINGNFARGVEFAAEILDVQGEVIPVTEGDMRLHIALKNGKVLSGENQLDHSDEIREIGLGYVFLDPVVRAYEKAVQRILSADAIIIGPGDLFGSILPNLLVEGISEAIADSKAEVIFNCNLTNKKGQTDGYDISAYVDRIEECLGRGRIDYVTCNSKQIPKDLVRKYEDREGEGSVISFARQENGHRSYKVVLGDFVQSDHVSANHDDPIAATRSFIRHDSDKLAETVMMLLEISRYESIIKNIR